VAAWSDAICGVFDCYQRFRHLHGQQASKPIKHERKIKTVFAE
jgi:hypothetical protein